MDMTSNADKIKDKLAALNPVLIEVGDDTVRHHGHAGHTGGDMTHLNLLIVSAAFEGKGRLARQRLVMDLIGPLWTHTNLHALSMKTLTPSEQLEAASRAG